jgi:hypothetical protein
MLTNCSIWRRTVSVSATVRIPQPYARPQPPAPAAVAAAPLVSRRLRDSPGTAARLACEQSAASDRIALALADGAM